MHVRTGSCQCAWPISINVLLEELNIISGKRQQQQQPAETTAQLLLASTV